MLILTRFSICINLLRDIASDGKLGCISFYIDLFRGVEIDKNRRLGKGSFKFLKTLFSIRSLLKRSSFSAILYIN
jgi:hypothetical protein